MRKKGKDVGAPRRYRLNWDAYPSLSGPASIGWGMRARTTQPRRNEQQIRRIKLARLKIDAAAPRIALAIAVTAGLLTACIGTGVAAPSDSCNTTGVVAQALPAIVNIRVVKITRENDAAASKPAGEKIDVSVGSGAIIDASGVIVTNKHVIQDSAMIEVTFNDKSQVPAQLIGAGALSDLALLKVDVGKPLPFLQFGDSDALRLGQPVIAVGNPLGIGTSVSTGVISGLDRDLMRSAFDDFIQTDASINPGNSGGPLLDCTGKIVGIDSALVSNSKVLGSIGLGFALPSNDVQFVARKLRDPLTSTATWVGLHLQDLTARLATVFGRPDISGAIVTGTDPDSPAARASLVAGDVITGANGHELPDARAILRFVLAQPLDTPISFTVWHQGHMSEVTLRTQPWPHIMALRSDVLASPADVAREAQEGIGLHLTAITEANSKRFGLSVDQGDLVDQVTPGSQADEADLRPGDVIVQVNDHPAPAPEVLSAQLRYGANAATDLVALLVHSAAATRWVTLYVGRVDVTALLFAPVMPAGPELAHDASATAPRQ
jgi:serine protease Do